MKLLKVDTIDEVKKKLDIHFSDIIKQQEEVDVLDSVGRVLAEKVTSKINMPEFNRSVVDGYAVKASDTFGSSESMPTFFSVAGSVEMGKPISLTIKNGEAVYVPTGGMIPEKTDAVVMIEYVETLDEKSIAIYKSAAPGDGIMCEGDDFKKGDVLFERGHRIKSKDIGVLAAIGKSKVRVFKKPTISIVSTGDELVNINTMPTLGQVRDINSYSLSALAKRVGCDIHNITFVPDDFELCKKTVSSAIAESDIVLISGGSSAGAKDMTVDIINAVGKPGVFVHGIAIKPGKPTIIANVDNKAIFGLPGHPLSAIIVYKAVVEYFIRKYYLDSLEEEETIQAILSSNVHASEGRETYQMVKLEKTEDDYFAIPLYSKSGAISILSNADGFIRINVNQEGVMKGEKVKVIKI